MSHRRRRHADHEEHENHERWLITYADMITLLMAFFVMMYGMSILDLKKFADFKAGAAKQLGKSPVISGGQGILFGGMGIGEAASAPISGTGPRDGASDAVEATGDVDQEHIGQLVTEIRRRLDDSGPGADSVEAEVDPRGAVLRFRDKVLFESGSASLSQEGLDILDQVALVLAHIDNMVVVEGHTDDLPTNGKMFATNWELSTYRATQVLRWLVQGRRLPAPRFSAAGYADIKPRFANNSDDHRALNRRVELIILAADAGTATAVGAATTPSATPDLAGDVADDIAEATGVHPTTTTTTSHETTHETTVTTAEGAHGHG